MNGRALVLTVLCLVPPLAQTAVQPPKDQAPETKATTIASPQAALTAYKQALEKADVLAFANLTAGSPGVTLRKLAGPLRKAQEASEKLDRALADKPALSVVNPFLEEFQPLKGFQLELVELTKEGNLHLARVRFGKTNQLKEETLSVLQEENTWRVSLPGDFLKSVNRLTPDKLARQIETLTKLTDILTKIAAEVTAGQLTTKESILIKLATAIKEAKLFENSR